MILSVDNSTMDIMGCDESIFADFLRDIMTPASLQQFNEQPQSTHETDTPSVPFRDLLSFGLESNLELNDQDYSVMNFYQGRGAHESSGLNEAHENSVSRYEQLTPQSNAPDEIDAERLALGSKAFRSSLWCWTPVRTDTGSSEQHNLTIQASDMSTQLAQSMYIHTDSLDSIARDRVVAMVLSTTSRSSFAKVMSSFPSVALLDNLANFFLASHIAQSDTWIHVPTFKAGRQRAELLGGIISAGAVLSASPTIRKLGFAIHEAVRQALPKVCEANNSVTRDLGLLQAMVLSLDVGLWSGNKRKIELAESHASVVTTMCRRASRFLRSNYKVIAPLETDYGQVLDYKWRSWAHQESLKRCVT